MNDSITRTFAPYRVADSGRSVEDVFAQVNEAVWYGYGPDYRAGGRTKVVSGPAYDFVALLEDLTAIPNARFVSHVELLAEPCGPDEIRIAIRHDIDTDIVAAQQQAEIEHDFGVVANWVVLHTAPYYGEVDAEAGVFRRNDAMIDVYRSLQDFGHEVSLHADPLGLYQFHDIDGAQGLVTELEWLRSHGLDIRGTTAHNHRPTYGAENYEIFKGFVSPQPNAQPADAEWVTHRGKGSPLRVLDERELGFVYEGNEIFWRDDLQLEYGSARFTNLWFWTDHQQRRNSSAEFFDREFLDQRRLIDEIEHLRPGSNVVLVVHPEYFGARTGPTSAPPISHDQADITRNNDVDWVAYTPWSVVAEAITADDRQTGQAINVANDIGMIDYPLEHGTPGDRRIVVVGSDNVDGSNVALPSQFGARLMALAAERMRHEVRVTKYAHPGMAIDRLWPWIRQSVERHDPEAVVLCVSASALEHFGMHRWQPAAELGGWVGEYLAVTGTADVVSCTWPTEATQTVTDLGALLRCYRHAIDWLRDRDIKPVLMVEESVGADLDEWMASDTRLALQTFATSLGVILVDPTKRIAAEQQRVGDDAPSHTWNATAHRVASEELFAALFAGATPSHLKNNFERRSEAAEAMLRGIEPGSRAAQPSHEAVVAQRRQRRDQRLLDLPVPFNSALSFVSDVDGAQTQFFFEYQRALVADRGLDHGDSIHFAGYHQRFSRGRRGLVAFVRALLTHDLRRDNAAANQSEAHGPRSWFAHVLHEYHRGNIDHLHGIYAWGARSMALDVSGRSGGATLTSAHPGLGERDRGNVAFANTTEHFPLITVAVETTSTEVPDRLSVRFRSIPLREQLQLRRGKGVAQQRPAELALVSTRTTTAGSTLATYAVDTDVLSPIDPRGANGVVPQHDLLGIDIDLAPETILSAALHNTNVTGVREAFAALRHRYNVVFDLITAHGRYHFYAAEALQAQADALDRMQERHGEIPVALFGHPNGAGGAVVAVADDPDSPAQVFPQLIDEGVRYLLPCGYISQKDGAWDVGDVTFPVIDRSGSAVHFLQRALPALAWEPDDDESGDLSRLSTFESRLAGALAQLDGAVADRDAAVDADGDADREPLLVPIYTHLGQTRDLGDAPDPWFEPGSSVDALAARIDGRSADGAARPWLTRASVLANYAATVQRLPDLTSRKRNEIRIDPRRDAITGRSVPENASQLFGVSFEVDDVDRMRVWFDDAPVDEVVRWHDRGAITLAPCPIRWPIIDSCDPRLVAMHPGDLGTVEADPSWRWVEESDSRNHGRLVIDDNGRAALRIDLDGLQPIGAQVVFAALRPGHGVQQFRVRLGTNGPAVFDIGDDPRRTTDASSARFDLRVRHGDWNNVTLPLWGFDWSQVDPDIATAPGRVVRSIAVEVFGEPGSTFDIGSLWLGRPRGTAPLWRTQGTHIGGDALGRTRVQFQRLDGDDLWQVNVEPDGFFSSPALSPGAWMVTVDDLDPVAIQVQSDRFDLRWAKGETRCALDDLAR